MLKKFFMKKKYEFISGLFDETTQKTILTIINLLDMELGEPNAMMTEYQRAKAQGWKTLKEYIKTLEMVVKYYHGRSERCREAE